MQSLNVAPCIPSKLIGRVPFNKQNQAPQIAQQNWFISGITRDSGGTALGSCTVDLFLTESDLKVNATVSDISGDFRFYVQPIVTHYAVAYLAGSPDVAGTTSNQLVGSSEAGSISAPAGIGTQTDTDTFTRANEDPLAGSWTVGTGAYILQSNTAIVKTASLSGDADAIRNTWVGGDNQYSQAEITSVGTSAGSGYGISVRHSSTASTKTMYRLVLDASGNYELQKFVTGSGTNIGSGTLSYVAGQKLGLSATGSATTTLKIWYNGFQVGANITDTSSPITTGKPGISYSSTLSGGNVDNWDAGTVP